MEDKVYDAIKSWAGIYTWHTGHPLDNRRFHEAITKLYYEVGASVDESTLREALQRHNENNPVGLGGKPSEQKIDEFTKRAVTILEYLDDEGRS